MGNVLSRGGDHDLASNPQAEPSLCQLVTDEQQVFELTDQLPDVEHLGHDNGAQGRQPVSCWLSLHPALAALAAHGVFAGDGSSCVCRQLCVQLCNMKPNWLQVCAACPGSMPALPVQCQQLPQQAPAAPPALHTSLPWREGLRQA